MSTVSYAEARKNLASVWDEAISTREPILVRQPGKEDIAIIAADELAGYMETAHLLSSPANAKRLFESLARIERGEGAVTTLEEIKRTVGLHDSKD